MKGCVPVCRCGLAEIGLRTNHQGASGYYGRCSLGAKRTDLSLAWRECTRMSLRDSVLWQAVMERLGQTLCSCGSFSKICQWSLIDLENCLTSDGSGVTSWRTFLELDVLGVLQRRVSRESRRALERLRVMISRGHSLARRDTVREWSFFLQYGVIFNEEVVSKSLQESNAFFAFK